MQERNVAVAPNNDRKYIEGERQRERRRRRGDRLIIAYGSRADLICNKLIALEVDALGDAGCDKEFTFPGRPNL